MICLFGGTFDPVHRGHLHAALSVCDALDLKRISLVLSARPSHREGPAADIEQRWDMLQIACGSDPRLVADDREIRRDAPSYTIETLSEVRSEHPRSALVWVIGSDAYALLRSWYQWQRIMELTSLVVLQRPGYPLALDPAMVAFTAERQVESLDGLGADDPGRVLVLEHQMLEVSAREIRRIVYSGGDPGHLLPVGVATYIRTHDLYGVVSDPRSVE